ncbi:serine/threonine-protein kinase [Streptomyces rubrisoli]|uniref:non-specific serine/threonine protein kinase n=1 Tax=Streptantibioticus rubrisoli TaxID=1387313 RepID=A0ABT1PF87_9ACTN|nr:serine/threonine-protein kinase PknG [Streptantibioticus rubrisoli]
MDDAPWWGLALVELPSIAAPAPAEALLAAPRVPEDRRLCPHCREPVGVGLGGQPSLVEGRCPYDGTYYSFVPRLRRNELLADRYRVQGVLGHGGFGWVYLAYDERLENRPVALKGLIDADDPAAVEEVHREKRFLIDLRHDDIVDIRDFVLHTPDDGPERRRSPAHQGYLVMEYVPGHPLTSAEVLGEIEVQHVIGYLLRVLRVFDHLHGSGYLFCDLKPTNLMVYRREVKVIDLGGVQEIGAPGTGAFSDDYAAPELAVTGPNVATDLYTVGRTLDDLFRATARRGAEEPEFDSLRQLIARATAHDPALRFPSAADMADQLSGVLRELASRRSGKAYPVPSRLFHRSTALIDNGLGALPPLGWWTTPAARTSAEEGSCRALTVEPPPPLTAAAALPQPLPDPRDPAAGFLATSVHDDPRLALSQLASYQQPTTEVELLSCRLQLRLGDTTAAHAALNRAAHRQQRDWRTHWHQGLLALADERFNDAREQFASCRAQVPGELAPRLALALCAEYQAQGSAELAAAAEQYQSVWATDTWYESAVFGRARTLARRMDRAGAVEALTDIPETSPHHRAARIAALRLLTGRLGNPGSPTASLPGAAELAEAERRLPLLGLDELDTRRLRTLIREAELARALDPAEGSAATTVRKARLLLEECYRRLAHWAPDQARHTVLIDLANAARPTTLR